MYYLSSLFNITPVFFIQYHPYMIWKKQKGGEQLNIIKQMQIKYNVENILLTILSVISPTLFKGNCIRKPRA